MTDTQVVPFDQNFIKNNRVTVFAEDAPNAKTKMVVRLVDENTGNAFAAEVDRVTPYGITMNILNPLPSENITPKDGPRAIMYAQTVGGYVLYDPDTNERLCTPHTLMSDVAKIATQKGWVVIAKGTLE